MTILLTADLHLTENVRDAYRFNFLRRLKSSIIKKYDVSCLVILGDLTETKDRHPAYLVNAIVDHLAAIAELCQIVVVRGNHDFLDLDYPFFQFLGRVPHIAWINHPTDAKSLPGEPLMGLGRCLILPHTSDYGLDWDPFVFEDQEWVLTHNTFSGAIGDNGQKLSGIPHTALPCPTISGDVHVPQTLGTITYVGAPYTIDFGDSYKPRFLLIDKGKLRSIAAGGPQKRLLEVKSISELSTEGLGEGDVLKIRIHLSPDQHAAWPKMQDEVRKWADRNGLYVHVVQPVMDQQRRRTEVNRSSSTKKSDADILKAYAKSRGVDEKTLRVGTKMMEKS